MRIKILLAVALIGILHKANCRPQTSTREATTIQQTIEDITPDLDKIAQRLKDLKQELHKQLLKFIIETHESISNFGGTLLDTISKLETGSTEISVIASRNSIDREKCINSQQTKLERVLKVAYMKTKRYSDASNQHISNFTEKTSSAITEADDMEKNINKMIGYCIRQHNLSWQKDKLKECFSNEINLLNKVVDDLSTHSKVDCDKSVLVNVTADMRSLIKWTNSIRSEFLTCISEAKDNSDDEKIDEIGTTTPLQLLTFHNNSSSAYIGKEIASYVNPGALYKVDVSSYSSQSFTNVKESDFSFEQFEQRRRIIQRIERLQNLFQQLQALRESQIPQKDLDSTKVSNQNSPLISTEEHLYKEVQKSPVQKQSFILYVSL